MATSRFISHKKSGTKYCKDCRYYNGGFCDRNGFKECLVSGKYIKDFISCSIERMINFGNHCGEEAKHFEPKETKKTIPIGYTVNDFINTEVKNL